MPNNEPIPALAGVSWRAEFHLPISSADGYWQVVDEVGSEVIATIDPNGTREDEAESLAKAIAGLPNLVRELVVVADLLEMVATASKKTGDAGGPVMRAHAKVIRALIDQVKGGGK